MVVYYAGTHTVAFHITFPNSFEKSQFEYFIYVSAKKSKKQCFVSCNLPPESTLLELVEKRLIEEMNEQPDQF